MVFDGIIPATKLKLMPYGLFSVADVTNHGTGDEHWVNAFDAESEACAFNASIVDVCGGDDIPVLLKEDERFKKVFPFGIKAEDECLSVGFKAEDRRARVIRQLQLITQKAVEQELWNGTYAQAASNDSAYLSDDDAVQVVSDAGGIAPVLGLALLEQALATCGAGVQGVIHMPRVIVNLVMDKLKLQDDRDDNYLTTINGNLISLGSGYDGRGPGEDEPQGALTPWMYATGPVFVHLGPPELVTPGAREATNIGTNVMTYVAVRPATAFWDGCCHFGVQVDLSKTVADGATAEDVVMDQDGIT